MRHARKLHRHLEMRLMIARTSGVDPLYAGVMNGPRDALVSLSAAAADGRLAAVCERMGIDLVSVFGSVLDESNPEPSDLDVGVRFTNGNDPDVLGASREFVDLVESDLVDLLVLNRASVVARSRALGPGARGLYERRTGDYARAQMAALSEEMETAWMRRRDLELLAER
jgi:predicted nucleotidyltransferase